MSRTIPIVIAHRGASGYLPEHTPEAKAMAHAVGADYIEQDVVLTRDGVPIILHDIHLDYTTDVGRRFPSRARQDGHYYALDFSLDEIRQLRAHERSQRDIDGLESAIYPGRFPLGQGDFCIPTLADEIALISGLNASRNANTGLYIELKAPNWHLSQGFDLAAAIMKILEQTGYAKRPDDVYLQCFDDATLKRLRDEFRTSLPLIQLLGDDRWGEDTAASFRHMLTPQGLAGVAQYADGIGPWLPQVLQMSAGNHLISTGLVEQAQKTGLVTHPYTLRRDELPPGANTLDEVHKALFIDAGADGAFSDFPDLTRIFIDKFVR